MKFVIDENLPRSLAVALKNNTTDAEHISDSHLQGASDKEVAEYAKKQQAILVTKDLEFGSSILYPKDSHYGLIIVRLPNNLRTQEITKTIQHFLAEIKQDMLTGSIAVLELGRYRIRQFR